jgi:hypothetical protein
MRFFATTIYNIISYNLVGSLICRFAKIVRIISWIDEEINMALNRDEKINLLELGNFFHVGDHVIGATPDIFTPEQMEKLKSILENVPPQELQAMPEAPASIVDSSTANSSTVDSSTMDSSSPSSHTLAPIVNASGPTLDVAARASARTASSTSRSTSSRVRASRARRMHQLENRTAYPFLNTTMNHQPGYMQPASNGLMDMNTNAPLFLAGARNGGSGFGMTTQSGTTQPGSNGLGGMMSHAATLLAGGGGFGMNTNSGSMQPASSAYIGGRSIYFQSTNNDLQQRTPSLMQQYTDAAWSDPQLNYKNQKIINQNLGPSLANTLQPNRNLPNRYHPYCQRPNSQQPSPLQSHLENLQFPQGYNQYHQSQQSHLHQQSAKPVTANKAWSDMSCRPGGHEQSPGSSHPDNSWITLPSSSKMTPSPASSRAGQMQGDESNHTQHMHQSSRQAISTTSKGEVLQTLQCASDPTSLSGNSMAVQALSLSEMISSRSWNRVQNRRGQGQSGDQNGRGLTLDPNDMFFTASASSTNGAHNMGPVSQNLSDMPLSNGSANSNYGGLTSHGGYSNTGAASQFPAQPTPQFAYQQMIYARNQRLKIQMGNSQQYQ